MPDHSGSVPGGRADKEVNRDAKQRIVPDEIAEDHECQDQANESRDEIGGHPFIPVRDLHGGRASR